MPKAGAGTGKKKAIAADSAAKVANQQRFAPGMMINPARAAADMEFDRGLNAGKEAPGQDYRHPQGVYHRGKFASSNIEYDTKLQMRQELIKQGAALNPGNAGMATPYGPMPAIDEKLLDYFKQKKDTEDWIRTLRMAELLADPRDPTSTRHMYTLFPELESIPQQEYAQRMFLNARIRELVRQGRPETKDDLQLLIFVLRDDFEFDEFPAWDPEGAITHDIEPWASFNRKAWERSRWNPRAYAVETDTSAKQARNRKCKYNIMRRCFKGLSDAPIAELDRILAGYNEGESGKMSQPFFDGRQASEAVWPNGTNLPAFYNTNAKMADRQAKSLRDVNVTIPHAYA